MITLFERFKSKLEDKIELNKKGIIEGMYLVIISNAYNWKTRKSGDNLILVQIRKIDDIKSSKFNNSFIANSEGEIIIKYADVLFLDFATEIEQQFELYKTESFSIESTTDFKKILYITPSRQDAQKKFDELVKQPPYCDWKIRQDANKYNL